MPSRLLPVTKPGETITVLAAAGTDPYVLDFAPSTATATQEGKNLVITLENGGRVIFQDFFATPDATPPVFLEGDQEIPLDALQPAAGPQQTVALRDGSSQDFTNSALMQGITALGGLDLSGSTISTATTPVLSTLTDTGTDATGGQAATGTTGGSTGGTGGGTGGDTTLPPLNTPPSVDAALASLTEDLATTTGQLPRSRDINVEDTLTFLPKINEVGIYGNLGLLSDGTYTYTLNNAAPAVQGLSAGQSLTERFTYTVTDGQGGTASNTLTITIRGTNDAPTVAATTANITEGVQQTIVGTLPTPQDVDTGDVVTFIPKTETGVYGSLTLLADGSYTFTLNGAATQGLGAGQTFTETYTYTVTDGQGGTASNTLTITVKGTNDAPTVAAATATVTEDTPTTITATLPMPQDVDTDDVATFVPKTDEVGTYGSLSLQADGTYTYTLNNNAAAVQALGAGQSVTETFTYTVTDGQGGMGTNTLTITVKGTNDAPTVAAATASITEGVQQTIVGTLPAPQDMDTGDVVTFIPKTETGVYGSLTLLADGSYTFTLNGAATQGLGAGQTFTETYTYTVTDGQGGTASNTLTITVKGTNDAPTVAAATAIVTEDTHVTVTSTLPTPQDVDTDDVATFVPKTDEVGTYGSLSLQADGTYTYTLNNNAAAVQALGVGQSLTETFTYTVTDGQGGMGTNTLTITVKGTNDAPTVAAATAIVSEDTHVTITATLPMPQDIDTGDVVTFVPKSNEAGIYGSLSLQADGTYTYTLNNNAAAVQALGVGQSVTETFTYTVTDGQGGTATNILTITVKGTNDAPTVAAATASITEGVQQTIVGTLPTPQDVDTGDVVTFIPKAEAGIYGSLTLQANGTYTYTLNNTASAVQSLGVGQSLTETFTYTVTDEQGGTATNTLTITVKGTNDAPTVAAATATVTEDTHVTVTATLPTPQDADTGAVVTFVPKVNEAGTYGSLSLQADGTYTYTLNSNAPAVQSLGVGQSVTETFTYTVTDGQGGMGTNTLTITVKGTNDAPTVAAATARVTEDTHTTVTASLPMPLDVDAGDVVTFIPKAEAGIYGSLTLQANGTYTYTLNNTASAVQSLGVGQSLTETFSYTITDGQGSTASNTLTITVKGTNDSPTVAAAVAEATEDTHTTITATLPTPQDADTGAVVTFIPKTNEAGTYGFLTLQANGTYTYTLNNNAPVVQALGAGQCAIETFSYTVSDGNGGYAVNTLTITINGTNDKPLPTAATAQVTEDLTLTTTGSLSATDPDRSDHLTFTPLSLQGQYGSLTLDSQGHYTYTLNNASPQVQALGKNALAMDSFTYTVMDNHGASASNTLTITVNGVNDAPTLASVQVTAKEDTFTVVQGALTAQDVDAGDTLSFLPKVHEPGLYGSLTLGSDGSYIYTLNNASPVVQGLGVGDTLSETFFVVVRDQNNALATATLNVTVNGTNDAPVAQAFTAAVTEDLTTTVTGRLWATDPDNTLDGRGTDTVSFEATTLSGGYGNLVLQADGSYTYTLNNSLDAVQGLTTGERLSDVFTYTVRDNYGAPSTNTLTVVVNGNNDNPITQAATATMQQNGPSTLYGCLPQPTDPDNTKDGVVSDTLHFVPIVNGYGTYGTLQMDASGNYSYTLNTSLPAVRNLKAGDSVRETFNYAVQDDHGGVSVNTFTLTILNPEDCKDDEDHRDDDGTSSGLLFALTMDVTEDVVLQAQTKFTLPLGLPLIGRTIEGDYGTLTINPNGSCTYVLHNELASVQGLSAGDSVVDHFTYLLSGLLGTVEVTVKGTNDAPQAQIFNNIVSEDRTLVATGSLRPVVDKDSGDTHIFSAQSSLTSQYGTLYLTDNGNYVYVLNAAAPAVQALGAEQTVVDSFTYMVTDSATATAQGTLRITVQGSNDNPVVADASLALHEDMGGAPGVLPAPTDVDTGDHPVYVAQEIDTTFGHISIAANGSYTYVLSHNAVQSLGAGQTAHDHVTYTVSDGRGGTATAHLSITIHGDNDAPTVAAATALVTEDSQLTAYGQLPHPVDADANDIPAFTPMNYVPGLFGSLDVRASGVYTYTLNNDHPQVQALGQGEQLTEVFTYTVSDGHGGVTTNTLTMIIQGSNDVPTVGAAVGSVNMYAFGHTPETLVGILPTAQDVDVQDTHTYSLLDDGNGQYGTLLVHDDGSYNYTPYASSLLHGLSSGESVTETFRFSVNDGNGGVAENTLTLTIRGINDAPLSGVAQLAVAQEDGPAIHGTLTLPDDPDNMGGTAHDQLSFTPQSSEGQFGSLELHSDGSYTYTLNNSLPAVQALGAMDTLTESFPCQVSDGKGGFASTTLEITVQGTTEPVVPEVTLTPSPTPESSPSMGAGDMGGSIPGTGSGADSTPDSTDMQEQLLQLSIQNGN